MGKGSASRLTKRRPPIISRQTVPGLRMRSDNLPGIGYLGTHRKRLKGRMPRVGQKGLFNFENMVLNRREKDNYE